jgi:hypothetical protein
VGTPLIESNRNSVALARDTDDAAGRGAECSGTLGKRIGIAAAAGRVRRVWLGRRGASTRCSWGRSGRRSTLLCLGQRHEVVVGNRVFVLLAQKFLFDQQIESRRIGVGKLPLKQSDRAGDLFATKDHFFFFFTLNGLFPHWHRDGHHHGHDRQADNQRRHGVSSFRAPSIDFVLTRLMHGN